MTDTTPLGDRMKGYERTETGRCFLPLLPVCARIDGKGFSRWTDGLERPYDARLSELMVATTKRLVEETQALVGYTQSDEINLLYNSEDAKRPIFLEGRVQKLTSILASMATAWFNAGVPSRIPERADQPALFDCRCWAMPTKEEAAEFFLWRERDATKNSLAMAARHHYPHDELLGLKTSALHDRLHDVGVNWSEYPAFFKRGVFVRPAGEGGVIDMPPFGRVGDRVAVLFDGAAP